MLLPGETATEPLKTSPKWLCDVPWVGSAMAPTAAKNLNPHDTGSKRPCLCRECRKGK